MVLVHCVFANQPDLERYVLQQVLPSCAVEAYIGLLDEDEMLQTSAMNAHHWSSYTALSCTEA